MKFNNFDKRYLKISFFVIFTVLMIKIIDLFIGNVPLLFTSIFDFIDGMFTLMIPVIAALCISYVLSNPIKGLSNLLYSKFHIKKKGLCRGIAIVFTYIVTIGLIIGMCLGIYYMIGGQLSKNLSIKSMIAYVQNYMANGTIDSNELAKQIDSLHIPFLNNFSGNIGTLIGYLQTFLNYLMKNIVTGVLGIGSNALTIIIALILSIYLSFSADYFLSLWDKFFFVIFRGSKTGRSVKRGLGIVNFTFSNYIRGQLIEAFFVAILISAVLMIVGVDYALVIGIITGILNLIPYIGAFIGVLLATLMGLFTGGPVMAIWAFVAAEGIQQLDANFICPKIVGNKVGIHPAFILIAISIGGTKWGLLGMILAVPVTASLITLLKLWYGRRFSKSYELYKTNKPEDIADLVEHPEHIMDDDFVDANTNSVTEEPKKEDALKFVKSIKEDIEDIMGDDRND